MKLQLFGGLLSTEKEHPIKLHTEAMLKLHPRGRLGKVPHYYKKHNVITFSIFSFSRGGIAMVYELLMKRQLTLLGRLRLGEICHRYIMQFTSALNCNWLHSKFNNHTMIYKTSGKEAGVDCLAVRINSSVCLSVFIYK